MIDADHVNKENILLGCYLAGLTQSRLTGVFPENNLLDQTPAIKIAFGMPYAETMVASDLPGYQKRKTGHQQNMDAFRETCERQGIHASIHKDTRMPFTEILTESRYADLMIIGSDLTFQSSDASRPTRFTKEFLMGAECPVIVAPGHFEGIDEIAFVCDESAASVYAIKQFSYLLPELENCKLTIVQVLENEAESGTHIGKLSQMISCHYSNVHFQKLYGKTSAEFSSYLFSKKKPS